MRIFLAVFYLALTTCAFAQQFVDVTNEYQINHSYTGNNYGSGVTVYDWNKDGLDDIVLCRMNQTPAFYENTEAGFVLIASPIPAMTEAKQLTFADYDNDGDPDIFVTVYNGNPHLFNNMGGFFFMDVTLAAGIPLQQAMSFGHSWADIDLDGYLDIHVCNYNGPGFPNPTFKNYLLKNNGDGTFTDIADQLSANGVSYYTLASVFTDFDGDFIPDLFVANDRFPVRNYLYKGHGDGTFTEVGQEAGVAQFIMSMCATIGDVQNDGLLDLYVTNTTDGNLMHINDGNGTFTQSAADIGVAINEFCWGSLLVDFDNDTWSDLFVNSSPNVTWPGRNHFFKNNGATGFSDMSEEAGFTATGFYNHSAAVGDFDNDGRYDLVFTRQQPGQTRVMRNATENTNHFIKVTLEGVTGNRDGVGSRVVAYAGGSAMHRYTTAGDGYLSQNSQHIIIGLGESTVVDSLVVVWPGGYTDKHYNLPANLSYHVVEGFELLAQIEHTQQDNVLCQGESITLTCQPSGMQYLWEDGQQTQSIAVSQPGTYSVQVFHPSGFFASAQTEITVVENPVFEATSADITCAGMQDGWVQVVPSADDLMIAWADGNVDWQRQNLMVGTYDFMVYSPFGCTAEGAKEIAEPEALLVESSIWENTEAEVCPLTWSGDILEFSGGTAPLTLKWYFEVLNAEGEVIQTDSLINIHTWSCKPGPLNIKLEAKDANQCGLNFETFADVIIGLEDVASVVNRVILWPNPTSEVSQISSDIGFDAWQVMDPTGRTVMSEKFTQVFQKQLLTEHLSEGVYFLRVMNGNDVLAIRSLVIAH